MLYSPHLCIAAQIITGYICLAPTSILETDPAFYILVYRDGVH
jgi:hypothetical protein